MSDSVQPRASVWREGFRLFRRNWLEWFNVAVWFFVLLALLQAFFMVHATNPAFTPILQKVTAAQQANRDLTPDELAGLLGVVKSTLLYMVPLLIVLLVQNFTYRVFFMRKQPGIGSPKLTVGRFFYTIWINIVVFIVTTASAFVLLGVPMMAGAALGQLSPFAMPAAIILGIIGAGVFVFVVFRLALTSILAVCAAKPVIKNSWKLMKGNCWRLFGNGILVWLVLLLFSLLALLIELVVSMGLAFAAQAIFDHVAPDPAVAAKSFIARFFHPGQGSVDEQVVIYIRIVFDSLNMCLLYGILWSFMCAATRVFYDEKRAADPSFKLVA